MSRTRKSWLKEKHFSHSSPTVPFQRTLLLNANPGRHHSERTARDCPFDRIAQTWRGRDSSAIPIPSSLPRESLLALKRRLDDNTPLEPRLASPFNTPVLLRLGKAIDAVKPLCRSYNSQRCADWAGNVWQSSSVSSFVPVSPMVRACPQSVAERGNLHSAN